MSKYDDLIHKIQFWAQKTENIRAIVIIGSQARTTDPADEWSDLDLLIITTDIKPYIESSDWLYQSDTPLLTFVEPTFDGSYERRALFTEILDVDFALSEPKQFKESLTFGAVREIFQRGYQVLLDNAGFVEVPSYNPYWDVVGETFEDVDGYRIVLQNRAWTA